jgi:predicted secreted hydrolase
VSAATFDGTTFDLRFTNLSNVMVQLGGGHATFTDPLDGVTVGENYYYSRPTMAAAGTITVGGVTEPVIGEGWFDREWRACCFGGYFHQPDPIFTQWHWAGFHLSDGSAWSFYRIFVQGHEDDGLMSDTANFLDSPLHGCRQGALAHGQFTLEHDGAWTSPHSGHTYPTRYHFVVPSEGLDVWVTPRVVDQEATEVPLALGFQPWYEGWATVTGTRHGVPVSGDGYLELFGFPG